MDEITLDYVYDVITESDDYPQLEAADRRLIEFVKDRMNGAKKIATQSSRKPGPSRLTSAHFKAKLPLYKRIIRMIEKGDNLKTLKIEYRRILSQLRKNVRQPDQFQKLTGQLEVLGEILIKSKNM
jgi:hypothetical protein